MQKLLNHYGSLLENGNVISTLQMAGKYSYRQEYQDIILDVGANGIRP